MLLLDALPCRFQFDFSAWQPLVNIIWRHRLITALLPGTLVLEGIFVCLEGVQGLTLRRLMKQGPEEEIDELFTSRSLFAMPHRVTPVDAIHLDVLGDVLQELPELAGRCFFHDAPEEQDESVDLGPELPLKPLEARMADLVEHPEAREGDPFQGFWFSSWIHTA